MNPGAFIAVGVYVLLVGWLTWEFTHLFTLSDEWAE